MAGANAHPRANFLNIDFTNFIFALFGPKPTTMDRKWGWGPKPKPKPKYRRWMSEP